MDTSKEDLLEMSEVVFPGKKLIRGHFKKKNQVHSPPFASPAISASDRDVTSVFSVKKTSIRCSSEDDSETVSENFPSHSSSSKSEINGKSPTRSSRQLQKTNAKIFSLKKSLDKMRRESVKVDARVQSIRRRLQLDEEKRIEIPAFSFVSFENDNFEVPVEENSELVQYVPSEPLQLYLNAAERDNLTNSCKQLRRRETSLNQLENPVRLRSLKPVYESCGAKSTSYFPPSQFQHLEEVRIIQDHVLELSVCYVKFLHHPLFSFEHVLQEQLQQVVEKYSKTVEGKSIEKLWEELDDQRRERKAQQEESGRSHEVTLRNLRKARDRLFKEARLQRNRLKSILNTWKAIKKVRANQGYCNTTVRLVIQKGAVDSTRLEDLFQQILQDLVEEKKAALEKKLKAQDQGELGSDRTNKSAFKVDEGKLEGELRRKFRESFRAPEEPELFLYLKHDQVITSEVESELENHRRKVASSTTFTVKISCNNIPVCKSKPAILNENFELEIGETFLVQLTTIPQCLSLEIFEHPHGLLKKKLAGLNVTIPQLGLLYREAKFSEKPFERHEIVHYKHTGVGSGCSLEDLLEGDDAFLEPAQLHTKGVLVCRVGWQRLQLHNDSGASPNQQLRKPMTKWGAVDEARMQNWLEAGRNKPDGAIAELDASFVLWKSDALNDQGSYFRLYADPEHRITFGKMEDIEANIRFQYLKLRDLNEIEFDGILIPNRIREIPFNLLVDFKKRKALEVEDDVSGMDLDTLRETGKRRLKQTQMQIFQRCKGLRDNLSYESLVDEKYLIYFEEVIKTALKNLLNWFRWHPKLSRPLPKIVARPCAGPEVAKHKVLITILRAKNIPARDGPVEVQPFLDIAFEDSVFITSAKSGTDPVWNEVLELPVKPLHADYLNPHALNGSISINLFDRTGSQDQPGQFWLGEVKVPLAALTTGLNLSGWFRVAKAQVLLGYEAQEEVPVSKSPKHGSREAATLIQLDLRLSPSLPCLEPSMANLPSNDVPYIKEHILKWSEAFNAAFPSRKFWGLAIDVSGRTNCITRFLRPLEPPQLNNEEFDVTPEQSLRYISLIPFTQCSGFYQNIWLTSEQLLNFMIGSVTDHCVTLTCFLLALKVDAYLLLGYGVPQGWTSYVLVREYSRDSDLANYVIFDVVYNEKFSLTDPCCPLQRVYAIANGENVWGNAQRHQTPAFLRFDLTRKSDWWPLFDTNLTAPTNFVNSKIYFDLENDFEYMERRLERKLKAKFSKWRPMEQTTFNHRVAEAFGSALRLLEMNSMYGRTNKDTLIELSKAISQYSIHGAVINVPFTNLQALVKRAKSLNLHLQSPGVTEFGLSVLVQVYPGRVLSVWMFLGRITEKSDE